MNAEDVLKEYICARYKSIRQFCYEFDLKYSTVVAMLSRGLRNSNIDTVFPVCKALGISVEDLVKKGEIVEIHESKPKHKRKLEAQNIFMRFMQNSGDFTLDGKPLTPEEAKIFFAGFQSLLDMIRRLRKEEE